MHVRLTSVSSAYWRADQSRESLVRIYGIVEPEDALKATLARLEEAKTRDHRKVGRDLDLFHIDPEGWTGSGALDATRVGDPGGAPGIHLKELTRQGYDQVYTPHIGKLGLYRTSGHFPYYQESQFPPMVDRDLMQQLAVEASCGELCNRMDEGDIDTCSNR